MYELLVIGDDPAGLATAALGARRGLSVGLTCPPVDGLQTGALLSETLRDLLPQLAVDVLRGSPTRFVTETGLIPLTDLRQQIVRRAERVSENRLHDLRTAGVDICIGEARFLDNNTIEVAGADTAHVLQAESIVVATGAASANDLQFARLRDHVLNADEVLRIERVPSRLVVIGADLRGIEFAALFAVAGSRVTVVDGSMPSCEAEDIGSDALIDVAMGMGVRFQLGADVIGLDPVHSDDTGSGVDVHLDNGDRLKAKCVLVTGRRIGRTKTLDLGAAGMVTDDTYRLWCDHQHRTWQENIFGVGEVVGFCPRDLDAAAQAAAVVDAITRPRRVPSPLGLRSERSRLSLPAN